MKVAKRTLIYIACCLIAAIILAFAVLVGLVGAGLLLALYIELELEARYRRKLHAQELAQEQAEAVQAAEMLLAGERQC